MNRIFIISGLEKWLVFSFFHFMLVSAGYSQVIKGSITDDTGESIPFVKVWIKNTSHGTITNGKGQYHLDVAQPRCQDPAQGGQHPLLLHLQQTSLHDMH